MLPDKQRLRTKKDFDTLWKRGRSVYGRTLGLRFAPNGLANVRFGVVIGLKISKRATKRNLAKRRIREALRREFAEHIRGYDVSVIGRSGILDCSYQEIVDELRILLGRARLM